MRILVIPHHYSPHLAIREIEFARCWAKRHEVYVVRPPLMNGERSLAQKLRFHLSALRTKFDASPDGLHWITFPSLYRFPAFQSHANRIALRSLLRKHRFDVILNASYWGNRLRPGQIGAEIPKGDYKYIFDLVDDHVGGYEFYGQSHEASVANKVLQQEISKADRVVTLTEYLRKICRDRYGRNSKVIPNGFHPPETVFQDEQSREALRAEVGLKRSPTLGYIGSLDAWVDLEFAIQVFLTLRNEIPELQFLVVGGGGKKEELQKKYLNERGLIFTGWIPRSEVGGYFQLIDLGLIPFEENTLTHAALPIKALEYGAYGRPVMASPLKGLQERGLPYVVCHRREIHGWCQWIKKLLPQKDREIPLTILKSYQWDNLAEQMEELF